MGSIAVGSYSITLKEIKAKRNKKLRLRQARIKRIKEAARERREWERHVKTQYDPWT